MVCGVCFERCCCYFLVAMSQSLSVLNIGIIMRHVGSARLLAVSLANAGFFSGAQAAGKDSQAQNMSDLLREFVLKYDPDCKSMPAGGSEIFIPCGLDRVEYSSRGGVMKHVELCDAKIPPWVANICKRNDAPAILKKLVQDLFAVTKGDGDSGTEDILLMLGGDARSIQPRLDKAVSLQHESHAKRALVVLGEREAFAHERHLGRDEFEIWERHRDQIKDTLNVPVNFLHGLPYSYMYDKYPPRSSTVDNALDLVYWIRVNKIPKDAIFLLAAEAGIDFRSAEIIRAVFEICGVQNSVVFAARTAADVNQVASLIQRPEHLYSLLNQMYFVLKQREQVFAHRDDLPIKILRDSAYESNAYKK